MGLGSSICKWHPTLSQFILWSKWGRLIMGWMRANNLKWNPDRTKVLLVSQLSGLGVGMSLWWMWFCSTWKYKFVAWDASGRSAACGWSDVSGGQIVLLSAEADSPALIISGDERSHHSNSWHPCLIIAMDLPLKMLWEPQLCTKCRTHLLAGARRFNHGTPICGSYIGSQCVSVSCLRWKC